MRRCRTLGASDTLIQVPAKIRKVDSYTEGNYLVYITPVYFLTKRVTIINVRDLFQHFPDLLGELEIGG